MTSAVISLKPHTELPDICMCLHNDYDGINVGIKSLPMPYKTLLSLTLSS